MAERMLAQTDEEISRYRKDSSAIPKSEGHYKNTKNGPQIPKKTIND